MATFTSKIGLKKPAGPEFLSRPDYNTNLDTIDTKIGTLWVNDGVIPPNSDLYIGRVVRELTSGKTFTAKDNGAGGFILMPLGGLANAQWVVYHFNATAIVTSVLDSMGKTTLDKIAGTLADTDVVIGTSDKTLNLVKPGIYSIQCSCFVTGANANFLRYSQITCDEEGIYNSLQPGANTCDQWTLNAQIFVGGSSRKLHFNVFQSSGGPLSFDSTVKISRVDIA